MEIRFALLPPAKISKLTADLAKKYAEKGKHRFLVDNKVLYPHNTLFKVEVKQKDYPALVNITRQYLKTVKPFPLKIDGYLVSQGGWLALNIKPSAQLTKFRENLFNEIQKYVSVRKGKLKSPYRPHLTMTRFYKKDVSSYVAGDSKTEEKFTAEHVGLCLSRQTQVYKILNVIKLK